MPAHSLAAAGAMKPRRIWVSLSQVTQFSHLADFLLSSSSISPMATSRGRMPEAAWKENRTIPFSIGKEKPTWYPKRKNHT